MNWGVLTGIGIGAAFGAWLRYGLALLLNPMFPTLPLGTVAANLLGGFLMGIAISNFPPYMGLPVEVRLAFATGFLGGLTTFSTFTAESVTLWMRGQWSWALLHIGTHLLGSIGLCLAGIGLGRLLTRH